MSWLEIFLLVYLQSLPADVLRGEVSFEEGRDDTGNGLNLLSSHDRIREFKQQLWYQAHIGQDLCDAAVTGENRDGEKTVCCNYWKI